MTPNDPDTELMLRFRGGDEAAFTVLVERFQGRIVSLAARVLGSANDAEDVAQEVFLRVYRARERYEPTAKFTTWVHRIAMNTSLNHLRRKKARRHLNAAMPEAGDDGAQATFEDEAAPTAHDRIEGRELAAVVRDAVDALPERQRLAILLNKYQGLSYEDTAAALELSVSAVKSLLTRARLNVKERIEPYVDAGQLRTGTAGDR